MSPKPSRRPGKHPVSRRRRTSDSLPGLDTVFQSAFRMARGLTGTADPLEAELVASTVLAMWELPLVGIDDPVDFIGQRYVQFLAAKRSPDALAVLLGLASVAPDALAKAARASSWRLQVTRVRAPAWADVPSQSRFTGAWASSDEYGDQDILVADFERETFAGYSVAALIDHSLGGIAKDVFMTDDPARLRTGWLETSGIPVRAIAVQEYVDRISRALELNSLTGYRREATNAPDARTFLEARLRDLPNPRPLRVAVLGDAARRRMEREFARSAAGRVFGGAAGLAHNFIAYAADYGSGDPLRWSPLVVEICLLDWLPRKVTLDGTAVAELPDVLRGWVRFAGERKGLSRAAIDATVAAVDEFEPQYRASMRDTGRFGPAKAIISAMLDEGVALTDQASLDAWLTDFNARPREERDRVLGRLGMPGLPPVRGR